MPTETKIAPEWYLELTLHDLITKICVPKGTKWMSIKDMEEIPLIEGSPADIAEDADPEWLEAHVYTWVELPGGSAIDAKIEINGSVDKNED